MDSISSLRLDFQQISNQNFDKVSDLIEYMGAVQAQDLAMAKWALGLRLKNATENTIDEAINSGQIIRTHVLRPTWHFVSPDSISWMIDLTAKRIKSQSKARLKQLEIDEMVLKKSVRILEKYLLSNKSIRRETITMEFENHSIRTNENRLSHILMELELNKIICSGGVENSKQTYALFDERIKHKNHLNKDESLARLADMYFQSHSPACLEDFVWWSGLSVSEAKSGIADIQKNLDVFVENDRNYYIWNRREAARNMSDSFFLLPAFDEFLISYKFRESSISDLYNRKAISDNGIFRPLMVLNGGVIGIWKRSLRSKKLHIETEIFIPQNENFEKLLNPAKDRFLKFAGF